MSKRKRESLNAGGASVNGYTHKRARYDDGNVRIENGGADPTQSEVLPPSGTFEDATLSNEERRAVRKVGKDSKKERRKARRELEEGVARKKPDVRARQADGTSQSVSSHNGKKDPHKRLTLATWKITEAIGGNLLNIDPGFSADENFLFLAYRSCVNVYSTNSSLHVRSLCIRRGNAVSGFALSRENPDRLYISSSSGLIEEWEWESGKRLSMWDISSQIYDLKLAFGSYTGEGSDIVYTVDKKKGQWMITAHRLSSDAKSQKAELQTVLKSKEPITAMKVLGKDQIIVAVTQQRIAIGFTSSPRHCPLRDRAYSWRDIECPEWITSMDAKVRPTTTSSATTIGSATSSISNTDTEIDVVAGGLKGSIFRYEDLLGKLIRRERTKGSPIPTPQRLHWHRNAVGSVRWSLDGNYLISGGEETVMVLWQLDTGRKQMLPHLSAALESIVVSPSGSSYAVRLANNSAMVLSTAELEPTVSISGLQVPAASASPIPTPYMATVNNPVSQTRSLLPSLAIAVSSEHPNQLFAATPTSYSSRTVMLPSYNATHLQTLDILSATQISKQALTRTKVTDLNLGPESNIIEEPNVTMIQLSQDGQCMATIDEWSPPLRDVEPFNIDTETAKKNRKSQLEIYLKFWLWNRDAKDWELVARVDNPHSHLSGDTRTGIQLLDMISEPAPSGFATVGSDSTVKIWREHNRTRNGVEVRGKDGRTLKNWECEVHVQLPTFDLLLASNVTSKLAYSEDGSLLVVGHQDAARGVVHVLDTYDWKVLTSLPNLVVGQLLGVGLIDRHLIVLSEQLLVWDLIDNSPSFVKPLETQGLTTQALSLFGFLAVDQSNLNFAISLPEIKKDAQHGVITEEKLRSSILVLNPKSDIPLYTASLPHALTALVPYEQRKGYLAVDSAAEIRIVTPTVSFKKSQPGNFSKALPPSTGMESVFNVGNPFATSKFTNTIPTMASSDLQDNDCPVVRAHQLADIFGNGPSLSLPPVHVLFEQVAALCSQK